MADPVRSTVGKRDAQGVVRHGAEWLTLWADPASVASPAERLRQASAGRERAERARALAATVRAIAGLRADATAPGTELPPVGEDWAAARGLGDQAGLRLRHHDPAMHAILAPRGARARTLFDILEQARTQALGVRLMPGILSNLAAAIAQRLDAMGLLRAHLAAQVPLAEALPMLALDSLLGHERPLLDSGAMDMWHRFARARFGPALAALRPHLADQAEYAAVAHEAVAAVLAAMQWDDSAQPAAPSQPADGARPETGTDEGEDAALEAPGGAKAAEDPGRGEASRAAGPAALGYWRFSTLDDRTVAAASLASPEELTALREQLDRSMADIRTAMTRLAHRLQRRLLAERMSAWSFDQDEGLLDTARLDRVVTAPGEALSFKRERLAPSRDTVACVLIDNSGSMRGRPIALAAMAADLAAQALERCGVTVEILGFTTASWRGGQSARRWVEAGRPPHPGRICDLLHIVYKSADQSYRQARAALALMLRDGLLRENVDGEALLWAASRLLARPERRRVLVVVSDGAPSDRATLDANDPLYLDRHLRETVARFEAERRIELSAIGIGHPVDGHYRDAVVVSGPEGLAPALLSQLGSRLRQRPPPIISSRY